MSIKYWYVSLPLSFFSNSFSHKELNVLCYFIQSVSKHFQINVTAAKVLFVYLFTNMTLINYRHNNYNKILGPKIYGN